ncbi:hypothetical protein CQW23_16780 [Capsicum baccatum]|uniref:Uncharacterized protein n=1 Tax=Capsicum baccatum TaxID=33114 RepID=A0A2G2WBX4_CAPBA|nr:hypothetical protein CQW23_16780 [Capsicum baccatum]
MTTSGDVLDGAVKHKINSNADCHWYRKMHLVVGLSSLTELLKWWIEFEVTVGFEIERASCKSLEFANQDGPIPQKLSTGPLSTLDLSCNNFLGKIPVWLGNLRSLTSLEMSTNHFNGHIPPDYCRLEGLKSFEGDIMIDVQSLIASSIESSSKIFFLDRIVWVGAEFTTKYNSYSYEGSIVDDMSGIDLSYNYLRGAIPKELGKLTKLHGFNLSHNYITGMIQSKFSNLENFETLDLSYNNLIRRIPTQLLELTTPAVLRVAHNNLIGMTAQHIAQFATFNKSSYAGNPYVCGLPLHINCMENKLPMSPLGPADCCEEADNGFPDIKSFYISFLVAYANMVLVMVLAHCDTKMSVYQESQANTRVTR